MWGDGCFSRVLPCHLVETRRMEQYLEAMAGNGKKLRELRFAGLHAIFEDAMPEECHYCIDVYYRALRGTDFQSVEFEEYKETCRACGWEFVCAFENIVVFKSGEKERPPELQTDTALKQEILKDVTLRAERKRLMVELGTMLFYCGPALLSLSRGLRSGELWGLNGIDFFSVLMAMLIPVMLVRTVWEYLSLAKRLRSGQPLPSKVRFLDSLAFLFVLLCVIMLFWALEGIWFRLWETVLLSLITCALLLVLILFDWRQKKTRKVAVLWAVDESSVFMGVGAVVMLVFVVMTSGTLPNSGAYRFMMSSSQEISQDCEFVWESGIRGAALYPEDAGVDVEDIGENAGDAGENAEDMGVDEEDADRESAAVERRVLLHDNISHYARWERLIYVEEDNLYGDYKNLNRRLRYVGSMAASLYDEKQIGKFLCSKQLSLEHAQRLELLPEFDSYLLASGKEMVHVRENLVVIHFLNGYDERTFDLSGQKEREAVAGRLRKTWELYRDGNPL